jgi:hypothetical protein
MCLIIGERGLRVARSQHLVEQIATDTAIRHVVKHIGAVALEGALVPLDLRRVDAT